MPRFREASQTLQQSLQPLYDPSEAAAISRATLCFITRKSYPDLLAHNPQLGSEELSQLNPITNELLTGRPLQYVLGEAWFLNQQYLVNESVLIPRPETEELVQWIIDDFKIGNPNRSILDIGTGSGCIPISLKLALPLASVSSCDIRREALKVAQSNAKTLNATVNFWEDDFLNHNDFLYESGYDLVVSNPPYIPQEEQEKLHPNVAKFEPGTALFVPSNDPLIFYRAIAIFGKTKLKADGAIYCELHQDYAIATARLFKEHGYATTLRQDLNGHDRMLKARFQ